MKVQVMRFTADSECLRPLVLATTLLLAGCGGGGGSAGSTDPVAEDAPAAEAPVVVEPAEDPDPVEPIEALDVELFALAEAAGVSGDALFNRTLPDINDPVAQLGKLLFFSKSLGGDLDVACVSCHHPALGGADGLSLSVGIGANDPDVLGPGRLSATGLPNVARNAPTVFNAGLWDTGLFFDSRVESFGKEEGANGAVSAIRTPEVAVDDADPNAGANLVAAQARFPVVDVQEMRGPTFESGNNSAAARDHLAARIGGYGVGAGELLTNNWLPLFESAFGPGSAQDLITFDNIAFALGEYQRSMTFVANPFSNYLAGAFDALTDQQKRGGILFFTSADDDGGGCSNCHSGDLFSDGEHHTVAFPQFGPGKGDGNGDDFGRQRETGAAVDRYAFRTPSLLNVELTAPYGHAGAYESLNQVLAHYNNPNNALGNFFDDAACGLPQFADLANCDDLYGASETNSAQALQKLQQERADGTTEFLNTGLNNAERTELVAFLRALTDPCAADRACLAPWIPQAGEDPDEQQLDARNAGGGLL